MREKLAIFVLLASAVAFAVDVEACSCPRQPTADDIIERAAAVFTGVAEHSEPSGPARSITTFRVIESFKGVAVGASVRIEHRSGSSASCGVKFSVGQTHTLAAYPTEAGSSLTTSLCSTWMFEPQVGHRDGLIQRLRTLRR